MNKYRIVFMGTPDFGVPALEAMDAHGYKPVAIYCQPDKINGRGRKINYSPVKSFALSHDIPVFQPESPKKPEEQEKLKELEKQIAELKKEDTETADSKLKLLNGQLTQLNASYQQALQEQADLESSSS